jgi:polysaccharide pyruvyl transferase WcaK-like protein
MTPELARTLTFVGYQGYGNLGDEAILSGIERLLDGTTLQAAVIVGGRAGPIPAFPDARRVLTARPRPSRSGIGALRSSGSLVLAGGGLLHDHFASVVPGYLAWVIVARLLRRRVVWLGVGVGPLRRPIFRRLAALALRLSSLVLVRDAASEALVRSIGGRVDAVMPDPAIFLEPATLTPSAAHAIAVVVRGTIDGGPNEARLLDALAGCIAAEAGRGRNAELLTFAGERDARVAAALADRVAGLRVARPSIRALPPIPSAALETLAAFEAVVSVRLHGVLLAAIQDRPFVAIGYDDKIAGLAAELHASDLVEPLETADASSIEARLRRAEDPDSRARVRARLGELRAGKPRIQRMLLDALGLAG